VTHDAAPPVSVTRRRFLASTAAIAVLASAGGRAHAASLSGILPWQPYSATPPTPVVPGGWTFFTPAEARAVEAIVDRLIPADDVSVGGKDAGCAVFIDRQLSGSYGSAQNLYMQPPFANGTPSQGFQSPLSPTGRYRQGLAGLDAYCKANFAGKSFDGLSPAEQDDLLKKMEANGIKFESGDAKSLFELLLQNTMEGFFADPIYGGNKDMVSWRMIGFPGARYDYRDHIDKHNQPYPLPPVSIMGNSTWVRR